MTGHSGAIAVAGSAITSLCGSCLARFRFATISSAVRFLSAIVTNVAPQFGEGIHLLRCPRCCNAWFEILQPFADFEQLRLTKLRQPPERVWFGQLFDAAAKPVHERLDRSLRRLAVASVELVPRTLKRDLALEQPAETLEPVVLRPRCSLAVRLPTSVLERVVHGQAPSERNWVVEVVRARFLARTVLLRLFLLRLDRQAQELAAALRGADVAAEPVLGALDVDAAAVVAVLVVVRVLVVVPKQRAFIGVVVVHFRFSLAQGDRRRWCAEAPGDFLDEGVDLGAHRRTR